MTTLTYQIEELDKELKKLATVRGRWMKNVWYESVLLVSLVLIIASICLLCFTFPTTPLPTPETHLDRTIYPSMYEDQQ